MAELGAASRGRARGCDRLQVERNRADDDSIYLGRVRVGRGGAGFAAALVLPGQSPRGAARSTRPLSRGDEQQAPRGGHRALEREVLGVIDPFGNRLVFNQPLPAA